MVGIGVRVGDWVLVGEASGVFVRVFVGVGLRVFVRVGVRDGEKVGVIEGVAVLVGVRLGVKVGYSDINNSAMLVEIARKVGNYVPDLSFGTHFFQDLVEADIRYLALYPDEEGAIFAQDFFKKSPNSLANLLPECEYLSNVIKVIDVPAVTDGCEACIVMDGDGETGLGFLCRPGSGA